MKVEEILTKARKILKYKTQTAMAKAMGVSSMALSNWKLRGAIPDDKAIWIYTQTGGRITLKSMGKGRKARK